MDSELLDVEQDREVFESAHREPEFNEKLRESWVYHEFCLEGETFDRKQFQDILAGQKAEHISDERRFEQIRIHNEIIGELLEGHESDADPQSLDWLKGMHRRLTEPVAAEESSPYRQQEVSPGVYYLDVIEPDGVEEAIQSLTDEPPSGKAHPVENLADFHAEFMRIFPFDARTGLVGRLSLNCSLLQHGYPPAIVHKTERDEYFNALKSAPETLVEVVVEGIKNTGRAAAEYTTMQ
jgi:Fic family protein